MNMKAFLTGYLRFGEIDFKPGWDGYQLRWLLLYTCNYGTRVLTGGACVSWSKWFYLTRETVWLSKVMTRVLNFLDPKHGYEAGPILWETTDTRYAVVGAYLFWLGIPLLVLL